MNNWFSRYGVPKRIVNDQGPEFESQRFAEFCDKFGAEKIRTSPYHPQTNGATERLHRTLNSMLGNVVADNQRDWDERLPAVMAAFRAAKHDSTGYSPNWLVFERENRMPIDITLGCVIGEEHRYNIYHEYVSDMQQRYRDSY